MGLKDLFPTLLQVLPAALRGVDRLICKTDPATTLFREDRWHPHAPDNAVEPEDSGQYMWPFSVERQL